MPVLSLEPFVHPPELLSDSVLPTDACDSWWVLRTRPRSEKALARLCLAQEVSFFLPLHTRRNHANRRVQNSYLPLFPGYMFLHGDAESRVKALETNLVAQCLPVADQIGLHADLSRIHRLLTSEVELAPEDGLQPGAAIEITEGAFAGMTGKLIRRGPRFRFVVEIEILRQGVSMEIERGMFRLL